MANTGSRLVELQLRAARGLGGPAEIMEVDQLEDRTLPTEDRVRIESALSGILGQAASVPQEQAEPNYDPRDPAHQRIKMQWDSYAEAEQHFAADNRDFVSRVQNARLPRAIVRFAIETKNPQIAYYLAHSSCGNLVRWLSELPPHDQKAELERLAHELLYSKKIPQEQRGISRLGDMETDSYLAHRASGNRAAESPRQLPRSREHLDADDYIRMRQDEKRDYRRMRGHR